MTLQLDLEGKDLLSLEDAIAYEFFMDNVNVTIENAKEEGIDIGEAIAKVAKASYMIANIFCIARYHNIEQTHDTDA
jgi:hypothetical protein